MNTSGAPFFWLTASGTWKSPVRFRFWTASAAATASPGGLLYGVLNGWAPDKCLQFGWASGVLAASSLNDYAEPADEKQVWDIYKGNARVQR